MVINNCFCCIWIYFSLHVLLFWYKGCNNRYKSCKWVTTNPLRLAATKIPWTICPCKLQQTKFREQFAHAACSGQMFLSNWPMQFAANKSSWTIDPWSLQCTKVPEQLAYSACSGHFCLTKAKPLTWLLSIICVWCSFIFYICNVNLSITQLLA